MTDDSYTCCCEVETVNLNLNLVKLLFQSSVRHTLCILSLKYHVSKAVNLTQYLWRAARATTWISSTQKCNCKQTDNHVKLILCDHIFTSFSRSLSFSVPGSPVRLRGGALRLPVAVEQQNNSATVKQKCSTTAPAYTSQNIIAAWQRVVNSFARKRRANKYLRCANCVNIAMWECASHLCSGG